MKRAIEFLDSSGHLSLEWNADDPDSVAQAQAEFDQLHAAGYSFFRTVKVDAFEPSDGKLEVRRVDAEEVRPRLESVQPVEELEQPRRRGRPRGGDKQQVSSQPTGERVVAARPMRGG